MKLRQKNYQTELIEFKRKKRDEACEAFVSRNDSPEAKELYYRLGAEYNEILTAMRGGARTLAELKTALSKRM